MVSDGNPVKRPDTLEVPTRDRDIKTKYGHRERAVVPVEPQFGGRTALQVEPGPDLLANLPLTEYRVNGLIQPTLH